jgi:hypothetical protein
MRIRCNGARRQFLLLRVVLMGCAARDVDRQEAQILHLMLIQP